MLSTTRRRSAAAVMLIGMAGTVLTGCETIEKETGLNRSTQTGAAAGAATGGIIAALAAANPAWIAASVILGGVAGGTIGNYLGKDDAERHARSHYSALDTLSAGQTSSWEDPKTGNNGSTTVISEWTEADGTVCKKYSETVHTSAKTVTEDGTACKIPGHDWKARQV